MQQALIRHIQRISVSASHQSVTNQVRPS